MRSTKIPRSPPSWTRQTNRARVPPPPSSADINKSRNSPALVRSQPAAKKNVMFSCCRVCHRNSLSSLRDGSSSWYLEFESRDLVACMGYSLRAATFGSCTANATRWKTPHSTPLRLNEWFVCMFFSVARPYHVFLGGKLSPDLTNASPARRLRQSMLFPDVGPLPVLELLRRRSPRRDAKSFILTWQNVDARTSSRSTRP